MKIKKVAKKSNVISMKDVKSKRFAKGLKVIYKINKNLENGGTFK
ncbi:hypothetical protein FPHOBKDP_00041 [Listeria phage LPJP1]|nr:hypothetical protein FPHOBKDP_00041 [Listeria phage LPJP1]